MPSSGFSTTSPCSATKAPDFALHRARPGSARSTAGSARRTVSRWRRAGHADRSRRERRFVCASFKHHRVVDELRVDGRILAREDHVDLASSRQAAGCSANQSCGSSRTRRAAPAAPRRRRRGARGRPGSCSAARSRVVALRAAGRAWSPCSAWIAAIGSISTARVRVMRAPWARGWRKRRNGSAANRRAAPRDVRLGPSMTTRARVKRDSRNPIIVLVTIGRTSALGLMWYLHRTYDAQLDSFAKYVG